jgi:hypothetical protein
MNDSSFYYRIPGRSGGVHPGAHRGDTAGSGNEFMSHARLFDYPDPRRLDLRATLRSIDKEWYVRVYRQRTAVPLIALVDVSASMNADASHRKSDVVAAFVESMGNSAFRTGDPAGMCGFDGDVRHDLFLPARHHIGMAQLMAGLLAGASGRHARSNGCGLPAAAQLLTASRSLVFILSDFHWPLAKLTVALDLLERAWLVPVVVWGESEVSPPTSSGLVRLRDAEGGQVRSLWVNAALRRKWLEQVALRRRALETLFAERQLRPLFITGAFDPEQVSRYFFESLP